MKFADKKDLKTLLEVTPDYTGLVYELGHECNCEYCQAIEDEAWICTKCNRSFDLDELPKVLKQGKCWICGNTVCDNTSLKKRILSYL